MLMHPPWPSAVTEITVVVESATAMLVAVLPVLHVQVTDDWGKTDSVTVSPGHAFCGPENSKTGAGNTVMFLAALVLHPALSIAVTE